MRCATRPRGDDGGASAGEASDAVDTRGLNGLSEARRRQDGGEAACQHRRARARGTEEKEIMGRTPASASVAPSTLVGRSPLDKSKPRVIGGCNAAGPAACRIAGLPKGEKHCSCREGIFPNTGG